MVFLFDALGAINMIDFSFEQSSTQAFYYIDEVLIDGEPIELDDWVVAYKNNICVGARHWNLCGGETCDVPVMGDDGLDVTDGYMNPGEIPDLKVFDSSEQELIDMSFYNYHPSIPNFLP